MLYDIYIIILTGFAVFGMYCFADTVLAFFTLAKMPPSVMFVKRSYDENTLRKIKFAEQNVPNNYTVFYPMDDGEDEFEQYEKLNSYLDDILGVKSVNKK